MAVVVRGGGRAAGGAPLECEVEAVGVGGAPRLRGRAVEVRARRDRHRIALLDPAAAAREVGRAARRRDVERVLVEDDLPVDDASCGVNAAAADASTSAASDGTGDGDGAHETSSPAALADSATLSSSPPSGGNSTGGPEATEAASSAGKAPPAIEWVSEASSAAAPISIGSPCAATYSSSSAWRSEWFIPGRKAGIGGGPPAAAGCRRRCVRSAAAFIGTPTERSITIWCTVMSSIATAAARRPRREAAFRDVARAPSGPCTPSTRSLAGVRRSMRHPGNSGPASS